MGQAWALLKAQVTLRHRLGITFYTLPCSKLNLFKDECCVIGKPFLMGGKEDCLNWLTLCQFRIFIVSDSCPVGVSPNIRSWLDILSHYHLQTHWRKKSDEIFLYSSLCCYVLSEFQARANRSHHGRPGRANKAKGRKNWYQKKVISAKDAKESRRCRCWMWGVGCK